MSNPNHARDLVPTTSKAPLLAWLLVALAPMNRTRVKQLLGSGRVLVNGVSITRHDHQLQPGDRVSVAREIPKHRNEIRGGVRILYQDEAVIVIDKPPGLLTVATEKEKLATAFVRLSTQLAERGLGRPFVVHRLDRETSGLLMFARTPEVRDRLQENWDAVEKKYLTVVEGEPRPHAGSIEGYLMEGRDLRVRAGNRPGGNAKRAVTHYRTVTVHGSHALVEVALETGRKHQIRVHLAELGCPVAGDTLYGARTNPAGRLCLHAWKLSLQPALLGKELSVEAPLPDQLRRVIHHPADS
jgi:23S rRNA pseudouridine1911/1915/1917 synthase